MTTRGVLAVLILVLAAIFAGHAFPADYVLWDAWPTRVGARWMGYHVARSDEAREVADALTRRGHRVKIRNAALGGHACLSSIPCLVEVVDGEPAPITEWWRDVQGPSADDVARVSGRERLAERLRVRSAALEDELGSLRTRRISLGALGEDVSALEAQELRLADESSALRARAVSLTTSQAGSDG